MPPMEVGPARALSAISARIARKAGGEDLPGANGIPAAPQAGESVTGAAAAAGSAVSSTTSQPAGPAVATSAALEAGAPPVDFDRVAVIRKAVESGNYPVIPTKIADAMIAAGVMLRSARA